MNLHACSEYPQPDYLLTELRPHQRTGVTKCLELLEGPLHGGILADEMGLGKTLTAIVACKENTAYVGGMFNLIVTTASSVSVWEDELKKHFVKVCYAPLFSGRMLDTHDYAGARTCRQTHQ